MSAPTATNVDDEPVVHPEPGVIEDWTSDLSDIEKLAFPEAQPKAEKAKAEPETVKPDAETPAEEPAVEPEVVTETPVETEEPEKTPVQARIDQLTARAKTAEEKAAKAETIQKALDELQNAQPVKFEDNSNNPLANVFTNEKLDEKLEAAYKTIDFCDANPNGATFVKDGRQVEMTAEEVRDEKAKANSVLRQSSKRAVWLEQYKSSEAKNRQDFPALYDPNHSDFARGNSILKSNPSLTSDPNFRRTIGLIIHGEKFLGQKKAETTTVAPVKAKPAPKAPGVIQANNGARSVPGKAESDPIAAFRKAGNDKDAQAAALMGFVERQPSRRAS